MPSPAVENPGRSFALVETGAGMSVLGDLIQRGQLTNAGEAGPGRWQCPCPMPRRRVMRWLTGSCISVNNHELRDRQHDLKGLERGESRERKGPLHPATRSIGNDDLPSPVPAGGVRRCPPETGGHLRLRRQRRAGRQPGPIGARPQSPLVFRPAPPGRTPKVRSLGQRLPGALGGKCTHPLD